MNIPNRRRPSGSQRPSNADEDLSQSHFNPNSFDKWAGSILRSTAAFTEVLEPHSPSTRTIYERRDSEEAAGAADEVDRTSLNDDARSALRGDDESFIFRNYGSTRSNEVADATRDFVEHYARDRTGSVTKSLLGSSAAGLVQHGDKIDVLESGSTIYQTIFNSVNILMGIGILSLPLGISYAGWFLGLLLLTASGLVTLYTAQLLSKCMDRDPSLQTYADLAYATFGDRYYTSLLFSAELLAACTALVVLFGDSLHALVPGLSATQFKVIGFFVFTPLSFIPLSVLSISSVLGIFATSTIVIVVIADGFIKGEAPGSLLHPALTNFWPSDWMKLPMAIGLMMSPWSAHSVFCNVYRDMRHPYRFGSAIRVSYGISYLLDLSMAVCGYVMFGNLVKDEVTQSIMDTEGFPQFINILIVVLVSIVPITKMPLNTRPIATTLDVLCGVDIRAISLSESTVGLSQLSRSIIRITIRVVVNLIPVILGIFVPSFDRIMALLGSALCYAICILLPICFYLTICQDQVSRSERLFLYALFVFACVLGTIGTVWAFL